MQDVWNMQDLPPLNEKVVVLRPTSPELIIDATRRAAAAAADGWQWETDWFLDGRVIDRETVKGWKPWYQLRDASSVGLVPA
ncbi:hypothetical protein C8J35_103491 [Rhizobium sp. PP-F2F-G38]|nr:hypothetical protein C8J35_103491 [Rhizobium sp. PP-F2F-G38]